MAYNQAMALVGKVGRRSWRARLATGVIYAVLALGGLTMVYPFGLMIATAFKGPTDQNDNRLIPLYWTDPDELLKKYVDDKYAGDLALIDSMAIGKEAGEPVIDAYDKFLAELPVDYWTAGFTTAANQATGRLSGRFQSWLRGKYGDIGRLNEAYVELNPAFQTVPLTPEGLSRKKFQPANLARDRDWREFKATLPVEFRVPVRAERMFQVWMQSHFANRLESVPPEVRGSATSFDEVRMPPAGPLVEQFRREALPARYQQETVEQRWAKVYPGEMPIRAWERRYVERNAGEIRREFTLRNLWYVLDYIALNGRSLLNTVIFCALTILAQLTVNPLAAYALSRFPMRSTGRILLFLLATMAFPAEVAMIPSFLLLKDLDLLNTFWALVLPGAAAGFSIFLLKGFFDSLPQELFESGQIDGAREWTMLFRIALPLSKPVLGYMALLAFMGAYGAFMYAFLVAQNREMWTLMVFIYQLGQYAPKSTMMAAITLAAIPTLLVFLACQRVIMRGIVLPGER